MAFNNAASQLDDIDARKVAFVNITDGLNSILVRLRLRKSQPQLTRDQAMGAYPVRNPALQWRVNEEGNVLVILPRRGDIQGKALGWLFMVPESKPVELDEVGTDVWNHCDGDHTVAEIVALLAEKYKLNKREVEVSLTEYLRTLGKRGLVGFMVDQKVAEEAGVAGQDIIGLEDIATTREQLRAAQDTAAEQAAEDARILEEMEQNGAQPETPPQDAGEPQDAPDLHSTDEEDNVD